MMSDKSKGDLKSTLPSKQKITAVIVVIILAIVIWQIMGLFSSSKPSKSAAPMKEEVTASIPPNAQGAMTAAPQQQQLQETPVAADTPLMQNQQEDQKKYLGKITELQLLRIDREIEETRQGIAAAKLATDTAEKHMKELSSKPEASVAYDAALLNPNDNSQAAQAAKAAIASHDYVVISVSMKFDKWSAVIGNQGKLYSVTEGDVLTPDGSTVVEISNDGVLLEKDGVRRKISMVSSI